MSANSEFMQKVRTTCEKFDGFLQNPATPASLRLWAEAVKYEWDVGLFTQAETDARLSAILALQHGSTPR